MESVIAGVAVTILRQRVDESLRAMQQIRDSGCLEVAAVAAEQISETLRLGGKVLFFGNGGSASDAGHLAAELLGRFYIDRPALPAISLPDTTAAMTAIANDYDYDSVFARQIVGHGRAGDVAVGLSTSGNSINVLRGLEAARNLGMVTVALTGQGGGKIGEVVDLCISVPSNDTPRVQELSMLVGHTICEIVERDLFPET